MKFFFYQNTFLIMLNNFNNDSPLKESLGPSVQSDNILTIVEQIIVLGARLGSHGNSFWGE